MESTTESPRLLTLGVALVTLVLITPLFFRAPTVETDLWWHLAAGREIVASRVVPLTDTFSFTFAGREWINHEWLWDAAYWAAYRIDPAAVAWLTVGVLLLLFAVLFSDGRKVGAPPLACAAAVLIAATGAHWFLSIRPQLMTLLLVAIVLATRKRRWAPLLWPLLVLVWVNLHGGFVFGIAAIGLLVLVRTAEASVAQGRLVIQRAAWISLALCLLVWMVNPWGWRIIGYPLDYLSDTGYREIGEWQAPDIGLDPRSYEGQFWVTALLGAAGAVLSFRKDAYPAALSAATLVMAVTSRRFIPLFLVSVAPLVALILGEIGRRAAQGLPLLRSRAAVVVLALSALLLAAGLWSSVKIGPNLLGSWTGIDRFPRAGLRYLRALGSPERVLNAYDWGGYLMLHAPEMKVFFDSRANTLYDEEILRDYKAFQAGQGPIAELVARYAPDVALVQRGAIVQALERLPEPWTVVYDDGTAVVLLPPKSSRSAPSPESALADEPGLQMILAARARTTGDLDAAVRHLERAIEGDPLLVRAYSELARAQLARGRKDEAARAIERGIRSYPQQRQRFRFYEGQAYLEAGDFEAALAALKRAYPRDPFGPRKFIAGLIARTELQIATGGAGTR